MVLDRKPGSSWLLVLAFGFLTLSASAQDASDPVAQGQPVAEQDGEAGQGGSEQDPAPELQPALDLRPSINGVEAAIRDFIAQQGTINTENEEERARRDLEAQENMAWWAAVMAGITAVSVLVTIAGVLLIKWTLTETRKAAVHADNAARAGWETVKQAELATAAAVRTTETTQKIADAQLRAYVGVTDINIELVGAATIRCIVSIKNFGQTPAYNLQGFLGIALGRKGRTLFCLPERPEVLQTPSTLGQTGITYYADTMEVPADIDAICSGSAEAVVLGRVVYKDFQGAPRSLSYLYITEGVVDGTARFKIAIAPHGNYSD